MAYARHDPLRSGSQPTPHEGLVTTPVSHTYRGTR